MEKAYTVEGYKLKTCIGEGVYALVFLAEKKDSGEICAIKAVHKGKRRRRGTQHAAKEIEAFSRLENMKGVPVLHKWIEDESALFFVMSHHKGPTANELCAMLTVDEILFLSLSILEIVDQMHKRGVYHLDIKPENIIIGKDGPVLVDFGCSIVSSCAEIEKSALPFEGTPAYMAPEMVKEEKTARIILAALDVWSFGCLIYYIAAGKEAFSSKTLYSLYPKILNCEADLSYLDRSIRRICQGVFVAQPAKRISVLALVEIVTEEIEKRTKKRKEER